MAAQISADEREMMKDAYRYLSQYIDPPPNGTDAAAEWWMAAARDVGQLADAKWHSHPLMTEVLLGIYNYLEYKAAHSRTPEPCI